MLFVPTMVLYCDMRNGKTFLIVVALALVLGSIGVAKAGKAFRNFQETQTIQFQEALGK